MQPQGFSSQTNQLLNNSAIPVLFALWRSSAQLHWIPTEGKSMLPMIRQTDRLLLNHDLSTLRRGSIIVFFQDGRLHAHRLLTVLPGPPRRYITKGDNVSHFDSPIPEEQIAGHVLAIQRGQRMISLTHWQWRVLGWLVATTTLSVATLYAELRRIKQKLWGESPLPGIDFLRKCSCWLLTTLMSLFAGLTSSENETLNQE